MKICSPSGTTAVLKDRYLHLAPDPETLEAQSLELGDRCTLEVKGEVSKQTIYELNRNHARVGLSKAGDALSPLTHITIGYKSAKGASKGLDLYVDCEALEAIRKAIPEPELTSKNPLELGKNKKSLGLKKKETSDRLSKPVSKPQRASRSSSSSSHSMGHSIHRAVIFIMAGILLINLPQVFAIITETAGVNGAATEHVSENTTAVISATPATVGDIAQNTKALIENMLTVMMGMFYILGVATFVRGIFELYRVSQSPG